MMKKYIVPTISVKELPVESLLAATSNGASTILDDQNQITDPGTIESRHNSFTIWGDDDEEE